MAVGQPAVSFGGADLSGRAVALYTISCAMTEGAGCCKCRLVGPVVQPTITQLNEHL